MIPLQVTLDRTSCLQRHSRQLDVLACNQRSMQHCMHSISHFSTGMHTTRPSGSKNQRNSITLSLTRLHSLQKGKHPHL